MNKIQIADELDKLLQVALCKFQDKAGAEVRESAEINGKNVEYRIFLDDDAECVEGECYVNGSAYDSDETINAILQSD